MKYYEKQAQAQKNRILARGPASSACLGSEIGLPECRGAFPGRSVSATLAVSGYRNPNARQGLQGNLSGAETAKSQLGSARPRGQVMILRCLQCVIWCFEKCVLASAVNSFHFFVRPFGPEHKGRCDVVHWCDSSCCMFLCDT